MSVSEVSAVRPSEEPEAGIERVLLGADRGRAQVLAAFGAVRRATEALAAPLKVEDTVAQTMEDVSPTRWHLAHTSWFFQTFVLEHFGADYRRPHPAYAYLFNSYYEQVGRQYPRPQRGWLTRPTLEEIGQYRGAIDEGVAELIERADDAVWPELAERLVLGMHHEQQHQELILTDIKHVLSVNPLFPAAYPLRPAAAAASATEQFVAYSGGVVVQGRDAAAEFCFDCETPAHRAVVVDFELATEPVTNGAWLEFIEEGGYDSLPEWWPSDGWAMARRQGWQHPLYWHRDEGGDWFEFTLHGLVPLDPAAPVCHLSWYEAQAFASFRGARLPTELELEQAALSDERGEAPAASGYYHPRAGLPGQVWCWSGSAFLPYPGFVPPKGPIGEYNGKFMSGQMVLRGGSCLTSRHHLRPTYRNFFAPGARWQMAGLRLARNLPNGG